MMKPYVGCILHYYIREDDEPTPAIVTRVNDDGTFALHIIYVDGSSFMPSIPFSRRPHAGHCSPIELRPEP